MATEFECPTCRTMANEWGADGCSCWLCSACNTTNPEGENECRHCRTTFCYDCGCVIVPVDDEREWAGDHVAGCFWAYRGEWKKVK